MPDLQPHSQILFEETFKRIATVLDVIAGDQEKQARHGAETDDRIDRLVEAQHRTDARIDRLITALVEFVELGRIRDVETAGKFSGLIDRPYPETGR